MLSPEVQQGILNAYSKKELSAKQIADSLHISENTVHYHLKKLGVQKRSISEAIRSINITKFGKKPFIVKEALSSKEEKLKIVGAMLYWGEGAKTGNSVKFANSDPEMIKTFLLFLRTICGVSESRLKILIHLYPDHEQKNIEAFWKKLTNIPSKNFNRSFIHHGKVGTYKNKSKYGTACINYSDSRLLKQILAWIEEYRVELASHTGHLSSVG